jgi:hypothetical protein
VDCEHESSWDSNGKQKLNDENIFENIKEGGILSMQRSHLLIVKWYDMRNVYIRNTVLDGRMADMWASRGAH